jgi:prophage antirepressor-like protein
MTANFFEDFVFNGRKVPILWENDKPYFRATEISAILEIKNVHSSLENFSENQKVIRQTDTHGGTQKTTFLTEVGMYRLVLNSKKKIAESFQLWVCDVIEKLRTTGSYELKDLKKTIEIYKHKAEEAVHKALVDAFDKKYVVYVGYIRTIDNKKLLKIGSTKQIKARAETLRDEFGTMYMLSVHECDANEKFEKFLHKHKKILPHRYNEIIHGTRRSHEAFLLNEDSEKQLSKIIQANRYKYRIKKDDDTDEEKDIILQDLEQKTKEKFTELQTEVVKFQEISDGAILKKAKEIEDLLQQRKAKAQNIGDDRKFKQGRGNKVQIYSPETLELVQTFSGELEATRPCEIFKDHRDLSVVRIKNAISENALYKNYRWAYLDRDLSDDTKQTLQPTVVTKQINKGVVAMINLQKTEITKVFEDQKGACEERATSPAAISKAVNKGTQSKGFYFKNWSEITNDDFPQFDEMKATYLETNELPEPRSTKNALKIQCLDSETKKIVKTFENMQQVIREHRCSRDTIKKAIKDEILLRGYFWKMAE